MTRFAVIVEKPGERTNNKNRRNERHAVINRQYSMSDVKQILTAKKHPLKDRFLWSVLTSSLQSRTALNH